MIARRPTRSDPRRAVGTLLQQIGLRLPTTLAEAQAAAHIDAELRRVGMSVSVDTFRTLAGSGRGTPALALVGLLAAAAGNALPFPALLLAVWGLVVAIGLLTMRFQPLFLRRGDSQNVVATRPAEKLPHWRVVLLARIDSPGETSGLRRLGASRGRASLPRVVAFAALVAFQGLHLLTGDPVWWYFQAAPAAYLLLLVGVALLPQKRFDSSAGGGALAALIAAAESAGPLRSVELWTVALGATAPGDGLENFLSRYPFPRGETLFVGLDQLDNGKLVLITREGMLPVRYADPYLLNLLTEIDASDPLIDAEPRPARSGSTLVAPLLAHGYRALTLSSYAHERAHSDDAANRDPLDALDLRLIEQTVRLLAGMVRKLDG